MLQPCNTVPLSLNYNGSVQWVAVAGSNEEGVTDKEVWFAMIINSHGQDDDLVFDVIWVERSDTRGKYYTLCESNPVTQICAGVVIMYGLEVCHHLVRKTKKRVFRVNTSLNFICKIWHSPQCRKQQLFDELITPVKSEAMDNTKIVDLKNGIKHEYINTDLWKASAQLAKCILHDAEKLKLTLINKWQIQMSTK